MKYYLLLLFAGLCFNGFAQPCKYFPADCPETRSDPYGSPEDSISRLDNPVIPQEIRMENRLRNQLTEMMNRIAAKEGWEVAELSEDLASGARDANGNVLSYPMRAPHWMQFHFQFIVNADSLKAWSSWLMEFTQRRLDNARAGKPDGGFEGERNRQRVHFRDVSLLVVEVGINMNFAKIVDGVAAPELSAGPMWMSNGAPDPIAVDLFNRSRQCALLLKGDWKRVNGGFVAGFANNKTMKCDAVQSLSVHLSGNSGAIRRWLGDVPAGELDGIR